MLESRSNDDDPALLYSSRRKFLTSAGKSSLEPPLEFKTRRQARRQIQIQNSFDKEDNAESVYLYLQKPTIPRKRESQFIFQSLLPSPKKSDMPAQRERDKVRRAGKFALGCVFLESFEYDANDNWMEEVTAGVKCWVNKSTGQVTTDCPWLAKKKSLIQISNSRKRLISSPMVPYDESVQNSTYGTGSLVYDGAEVDELFKLLDRVDSQKRV